MRVKKQIGLIALMLVVTVIFNTGSAITDHTVSSLELEVFELVNEYRAENGIEPLELNDT